MLVSRHGAGHVVIASMNDVNHPAFTSPLPVGTVPVTTLIVGQRGKRAWPLFPSDLPPPGASRATSLQAGQQAGHLRPLLSEKGSRPFCGENLCCLWSEDIKVALSLLAG